MSRRELKAYQIRACRRPPTWEAVCTTVSVFDKESRPWYCYINFSARFIEDVGRALSRGVSKEDPAYIIVSPDVNSRWRVYAGYLKTNERSLLWVTENSLPPPWLSMHKIKENEDVSGVKTQGDSARGGTGR